MIGFGRFCASPYPPYLQLFFFAGGKPARVEPQGAVSPVMLANITYLARQTRAKSREYTRKDEFGMFWRYLVSIGNLSHHSSKFSLFTPSRHILGAFVCTIIAIPPIT